MKRNFPCISGDVTLQELVDKQILIGGVRYFVVGDATGLIGMVTLASIQRIPRSEWPTTTASAVMVPVQKLATIRPDARLWSALEKMGRDGVNQLPVVDGSGIVGLLSREDILHYLTVLRAFAA